MLSTKELLLLAQLGRLRADDRLWRPGSSDRQSIRSFLGPAKPSPSPHMTLFRKQLPPAAAVATLSPSTEEQAPAEASPEMTAAVAAAERGGERNWARIGAIAGALIVVGVVAVVGLGVVAGLQPDTAGTEESAATRAVAPGPAPVAVNSPAPSKPPVTTDEVAVRKVKVLDIAAPPPDLPSMLGPASR